MAGGQALCLGGRLKLLFRNVLYFACSGIDFQTEGSMRDTHGNPNRFRKCRLSPAVEAGTSEPLPLSGLLVFDRRTRQSGRVRIV